MNSHEAIWIEFVSNITIWNPIVNIWPNVVAAGRASEHPTVKSRLLVYLTNWSAEHRDGWDRLTHAGDLSDRGWAEAVGRLDAVLRRYYGVHEYTDSPDCVFRIALCKAGYPMLLADDTLVRAGDVIGRLHFWNEHLPRFPPAGLDLRWAKIMQSRIRHSLRALCTHMERDPAWSDVHALRADIPLSLRPLARQQLLRVAHRHGLEPAGAHDLPRSRVKIVAENMLLWGFTRAYNPAALPRHNLHQDRQVLWLSRNTLTARYGKASHRNPQRPQADRGT